MRAVEAPSARSARMNSVFFSASVAVRATRALAFGIVVMMTMASTTPRLGPVSATVASASRIVGNDRTASKTNEKQVVEPARPEARDHAQRQCPITSETETRSPRSAAPPAPRRECAEKVSRPSWSVPARWVQDGGDIRAGMFERVGVVGRDQRREDWRLRRKIRTSASPIMPCTSVRKCLSFFAPLANARFRARFRGGRLGPALRAPRAAGGGSERLSDTGIERCDEEVRDQDDEDVEAGGHKHAPPALHEGGKIPRPTRRRRSSCPDRGGQR